MIMRKIEEEGISQLKLKIIQNINDLYEMIKWNERHGIKVLRISSEFISSFQ